MLLAFACVAMGNENSQEAINNLQNYLDQGDSPSNSQQTSKNQSNLLERFPNYSNMSQNDLQSELSDPWVISSR